MKAKSKHTPREGAILPVIMVVMIIFSIVVLSLYSLANHSSREAVYEEQSVKAFWLAEAGGQWCENDLYKGGDGTTSAQQIGSDPNHTFRVEEVTGDSSSRIAIGSVNAGGQVVERAIQLSVVFAIPQLEDVIHGANDDGIPWALKLSGEQLASYGEDGPPPPTSQNNHYPDGNDIAIGNISINGALRMYGESKVKGVPSPNTYEVNGDVEYTQDLYTENPGSTHIEGGIAQTTISDYADHPDLLAMEYSSNHTYDVAQEFLDAGVLSGRLPSDHELYDIVQKNVHPNGDPTDGQDDFYFQSTSSSYGDNTPATGREELVLGDAIYYVDGHVWFHKQGPYGFEVDGQAVIVSSRDIHISDNLTYKDRGRDADDDMLALVALGQYSGSVLDSYGNIYFGDPEYGTLYTCDAFMFANNDFYYNTLSTGSDAGEQKEPESGFKVFGNFMAMNQIVIRRDWYKSDSGGDYRAADYIENPTVPGEWIWVDIESYESGGVASAYTLSEDEVDSLRHYAMQVEYDDRIRDVATQMEGLPQGNGTIFAGIDDWQEVAVP